MIDHCTLLQLIKSQCTSTCWHSSMRRRTHGTVPLHILFWDCCYSHPPTVASGCDKWSLTLACKHLHFDDIRQAKSPKGCDGVGEAMERLVLRQHGLRWKCVHASGT